MSTAHMDTLPLELFCRILILSCSPSESTLTHDPRNLCKLLTSLRLVSKRWDAIVTSIPQLWSNFIVLVTSEGPWPSISVLLRWLDRSSNAPLDFVFLFANPQLDTTEGYVKMVDALKSSMHRWNSAYVWASNGSFLPILSVHAHMLKSLSFTEVSMVGEKTTESFLDNISKLSNLQYLELACLDRITAQAVAGSMTQPLNNLSTLKLTGLAGCWNSFWDICRHCTSLSRIFLHIRRNYSEDSTTQTVHPHTNPITMPNLKILDIRIQQLDETTRLPSTSSLIAPNLRILSISNTNDHDFSIGEMISTFVSTSSHSLHLLRIYELKSDGLFTLLKNSAILAIPTFEVGVPPSEDEDLEATRLTVCEWVEKVGRQVRVVESIHGESLIVGWVSTNRSPIELQNYLEEETTSKWIAFERSFH